MTGCIKSSDLRSTAKDKAALFGSTLKREDAGGAEGAKEYFSGARNPASWSIAPIGRGSIRKIVPFEKKNSFFKLSYD